MLVSMLCTDAQATCHIKACPPCSVCMMLRCITIALVVIGKVLLIVGLAGGLSGGGGGCFVELG